LRSIFRGFVLRRLARFGVIALAATFGSAAALPAQASASQMAGVHMHLLWSDVSDSRMDTLFDEARAANVGVARVDLGWSSLEQEGKGRWSSWYLGQIDKVVNKAEARGIKILFSLDWTPCWASSAPDSLKQNCAGSWWSRSVQLYPPNNAQDYADALAFLIRRYGSRVAAWEIWNEPNSDTYFKASDKVGAYAALVKAAYPAAKAADPNSVILAGSLQNADANFTDALYKHGVKGYFDAFSVHPYNGDRDPATSIGSQYGQYTFTEGVPLVHNVMAQYGDNKPMWLTEFGWNTSNVRNAATWENGVDEATQALYLTKAYAQMQQWSYVQAGIWYEVVDMGADKNDPLSNYGLLRYDYSEKPSFAAFRTAASAVSSGSPLQTGTTSGSGSGTTSPRKRPKRSVRLHLSLRRSSGRMEAVGTSTRSGTVALTLYPRSKLARRALGRRSLHVRLRLRRAGRFALRLRPRALRRGRWRAVATLVGTPTARSTSRV
jgi:hypothetical protein